MTVLKTYLLVLLILINYFSYAQNYKQYTIKDGLPSNNVYRITQDHNGFVWFITDNGIARFDGKRFKVFTTRDGLPNNNIWNIRITPDNKVWFFTKSSKLGYIENGKIFAFPAINKSIMSPAIIYQNKNNISFAGSGLLYELLDGYWTFVKKRNIRELGLPNSYHDIDNIVLSTSKNEIYFRNNSKIVWQEIVAEKYSGYNGSRGLIWDSFHYLIAPNCVMFFDLKNQKKTELLIPDLFDFDQNRKKRLHAVNDQVQITGPGFLSILSNKLELIDSMTFDEKYNSHFAFKDKTGNIWLATQNEGVFFQHSFKDQSETYFNGKLIEEIELINDELLVAVYQSGLHSLDLTDFSSKLIGEYDDHTYSVCQHDSLSNILLSTFLNLYIYDSHKFTLKRIKPPHPIQYASNIFGREFLFFNEKLFTNNYLGLIILNPMDYSILHSIELSGITDLLNLKDDLFLASSEGLFLYKDDSIVKVGAAPILNRPVLCLERLDANSMVVGTDSYGAYIFDGNLAKEIPGIDPLTVKDIYVVNESEFWMATGTGLHQLIKNEGVFGLANSFYESDVLPSNNVLSVTLADSFIFAGTEKGLCQFRLRDLEKGNALQQLQSIYIESVKFGDQLYSIHNLPQFARSNKSIQVNFGVIDFSDQDRLTLEYRLEPFDEDWVSLTSSELNLSGLSPGNYDLEFRASGANNKTVFTSLPIYIKPYFWQTVLFRLCILFSVFGISLTLVWYFSRKRILALNRKLELEKQFSELNLKALRSQMNPHFVFNSLSAIQYYINENDFESSEKYLVKFSRLIRTFFDLSSENQISLLREVELLTNYLDIEKLRFKDHLSYQFNIDPGLDLENEEIPTMLLQPVVENAVNHGVFNKSTPGSVTLEFSRLSDSSIQVVISDDGVGVVNTRSSSGKSKRSSSVLNDRIHFLNSSGTWVVHYSSQPLFSDRENVGNKSIFNIKRSR